MAEQMTRKEINLYTHYLPFRKKNTQALKYLYTMDLQTFTDMHQPVHIASCQFCRRLYKLQSYFPFCKAIP